LVVSAAAVAGAVVAAAVVVVLLLLVVIVGCRYYGKSGLLLPLLRARCYGDNMHCCCCCCWPEVPACRASAAALVAVALA